MTKTKEEKHIVIPVDVEQNPDLLPMTRILYGRLLSMSGKKGYCWPTNQRIASTYGASVRQVNNWIKELKEAGLIDVTLIYRHGTKSVERRVIRPIKPKPTKDPNPFPLDEKEIEEEPETIEDQPRQRLGHRSAFDQYAPEPDPVAIDVNQDKGGYYRVFNDTVQSRNTSMERLLLNNRIHPGNRGSFLIDCLDNAMEKSPVVRGDKHAWNIISRYARETQGKYTELKTDPNSLNGNNW